MAKPFVLAKALEEDSIFIRSLPLCEARLFNEARFPWIILIPRVMPAIEWIDLSESQQGAVIKEINTISRILKMKLQCDKINIATLGNVVPQLHIHVIGRFDNDPLWPKPVFGVSTQRYEKSALQETLTCWQKWLNN